MPPHTGRTLAAVFNPCSLSANHSERRASIHPGINSRDSPPPPLLSFSLSFSLPGFFYPRGSTMACRSAGARRSFGINGRAWRAIFFLHFSVSRIVLNARKIARHEIERIEELKISRMNRLLTAKEKILFYDKLHYKFNLRMAHTCCRSQIFLKNFKINFLSEQNFDIQIFKYLIYCFLSILKIKSPITISLKFI